jgi:hypothetical protein
VVGTLRNERLKEQDAVPVCGSKVAVHACDESKELVGQSQILFLQSGYRLRDSTSIAAFRASSAEVWLMASEAPGGPDHTTPNE